MGPRLKSAGRRHWAARRAGAEEWRGRNLNPREKIKELRQSRPAPISLSYNHVSAPRELGAFRVNLPSLGAAGVCPLPPGQAKSGTQNVNKSKIKINPGQTAESW